MVKHKTWAILFLLYIGILFLLVSGITGYIDPFFHYHAPVDALQYPIENAQYQNIGIIQHFDYDAIILGTSMTDNFRTSEFDMLFGTNSVKTPTQGGNFAEVWQNLEIALNTNPNIKTVLFALDSWFISDIAYGSEPRDTIPQFLYDHNPFNDVEYLLNKDVLFSNTLKVLTYTHQGHKTTSFDDYDHWRDASFGREIALSTYTRPQLAETTWVVTDDYIADLNKGIETRIFSLTRAFPDVTFYIYLPPYSAIFWDRANQHLSLENDTIVLRELSRILLQEPNIQLYSFHDDFEITTDLNNYLDDCHHTSEINSRILNSIHQGHHQLTLDNYVIYWDRFLDFYTAFDFDSLWETEETNSN